MTLQRYIHDLKERCLPQNIGTKAHKLRFLAEKGYKIPSTYVCTWDAYLAYLNNDPQLNEHIKSELSTIIKPDRYYAVRSSANLEDLSDYSFAGQFKTILQVKGIEALMSALETIWSSTRSEGVKAYLDKIALDYNQLTMAVIIQEMVPARISGVSFSRNPLTGMDETIVEALPGSGEDLLQNGITPERWVNKWGTWVEKPINGKIELPLIQEVVDKTREISRAYGKDLDLEWVYDGQEITWVQLRDITSLISMGPYSRRFANEVFPGIIKPLIWSLNVPIVCGAWIKLFGELLGPTDLEPRSLARLFYYRAYFNMGTIGKIFELLGLPGNTIELLMGIPAEGTGKPSFKPTLKTLRHLPRLLTFALDKLTFDRTFRSALTTQASHYHSFSPNPSQNIPPQALLEEIERLYQVNQKTAYYTIVIFLLMGFYNGILKYQLKKNGIDFEQLDLTRGMEELKQFDPLANLQRLHALFCTLDQATQESLRKGTFNEFLAHEGIAPFQREVRAFVAHFGHLSNSGNDFSSVPWKEDPDLVLTMITRYTCPDEKTTPRLDFDHLPLSPLRRMVLKPLYQRARRYRLYREQVSFLYTSGYGLFRPYFLTLGDHFVYQGIIEKREDIFYLYYDEIKEIVAGGTKKASKETVALRKREMEDYQDIYLPETIYGDHPPPPLKTREGSQLRGIPTSRGYYRGRARVIRGIKDLSQVQNGDVLIIPYSDVGLTPLFSKAGAIIAESGGFLSHSSIIAREYGIPAIVSVAGACQLKDGTLVTVDGYKGEITIHESNDLPHSSANTQDKGEGCS